MALLNNRYSIQRKLGGGGCGQTFLATDTHLPSQRTCVVKQLKPATTDPIARQIIQQRFEREAEILERIGTTNNQIPELYAYFTESGELYLVQEYIDGQNLTERVSKDGPFTDGEVKDILVSLLLVLHTVHSQGIIHRDIKPDNILLRRQDDMPVLIDFGAVKEIVTAALTPQLSPTSVVIGTPIFMPHEQLAGKPIFASDLYSLGLTAIYLLTGKLPPALIDPTDGGMRWWSHASNTSRLLSQVIDKSIAPLAQDRYQDALKMLSDLCQRIEWCTPYMYRVMLQRMAGGGMSPNDIEKAAERFRVSFDKTNGQRASLIRM